MTRLQAFYCSFVLPNCAVARLRYFGIIITKSKEYDNTHKCNSMRFINAVLCKYFSGVKTGLNMTLDLFNTFL